MFFPGESTVTAATPETVHCDRCGHLIGVYERLVVFRDGLAFETTRAEEFRLPLTVALYFHRDCYRMR